jgi:hypothetical protein
MPDDNDAQQDAQQIAERTSKTVQPDDPFVEPPNSTVDDWFGQRVQDDADRLDGSGADGAPHATGEQQARENSENDPPA